MNIGERIRLVRETSSDKKLSMAAFAERIGVSSGAVSQWENNQKGPSGSAVRMISKEFGINETWLLTGEGDMHSETSKNQRIAQIVASLVTADEPVKLSLISLLSTASESQLRAAVLHIYEELKKNGFSFEE